MEREEFCRQRLAGKIAVLFDFQQQRPEMGKRGREI